MSTMREMCETVVSVHNDCRTRGIPSFLPARLAARDDLDPERDIFGYDPHGELWPVFAMYSDAITTRDRLLTQN